MKTGSFKFVPIMGPQRAVINAPIKKGQMLICTDIDDNLKKKIYFDISETERILISTNSEEFDPYRLFEELTTRNKNIISAINELNEDKVGWADIVNVNSIL